MSHGVDSAAHRRDWSRRAVREALRRVLGRVVRPALADRVRRELQHGSGWRRAALMPLVRVLRHTSLEGRSPFVLLDDPGVRLASVDSSLTQILYWFGEAGYESALLGWWRWLVRDARSVLEVGCNVGIFTVIGRRSNPECRYRAVDANQEACDLVGQNVALNGLGGVDVIHAAVVDTDQPTAVLAMPVREAPRAPTMAFVTSTAHVAMPIRTTVEVPAARARSLLQDADLVKLDIEGSEAAFLHDALSGLVANQATLVVELLPGNVELREILASMTEGTYHAFIPEHGRLRPVPSLLAFDGAASRDLLLIPRDKVVPWLDRFVF